MITFVRTRHNYDSYADFWRFVTLSRFPIVYLDEMDPEYTGVYITTPFNGETLSAADRVRAAGKSKIVWWLLERDPADALFHGNKSDALDHHPFNQIWVSDPWYAQQHSSLTYVPMGGVASLYSSTPTPAQFDVVHLAYIWGRRQAIVDAMLQRKFSIAPAVWDDASKDSVLRSSKIMVNLHQYDHAPIVAPIRLALAASHKLPFVTEKIADPGIVAPMILQGKGESLLAIIDSLRHDPVRASALGGVLHQTLAVDHSFRSFVEEACLGL